MSGHQHSSESLGADISTLLLCGFSSRNVINYFLTFYSLNKNSSKNPHHGHFFFFSHVWFLFVCCFCFNSQLSYLHHSTEYFRVAAWGKRFPLPSFWAMFCSAPSLIIPHNLPSPKHIHLPSLDFLLVMEARKKLVFSPLFMKQISVHRYKNRSLVYITWRKLFYTTTICVLVQLA